MNTQNTKVNSVLFRRELAKWGLHGIKPSDDRSAIELFNVGKGFRKTKIWLGAVGAYILMSLTATALDYPSVGVAIGISGIALLIVKWINEFHKEFRAKTIFDEIFEHIKLKKNMFIAAFPHSEHMMLWASTMKDADDAHQFVLDYARMEVILLARQIEAGSEALRVDIKVKFAAATLLFGKSFDRGQKYELFFNERIVSQMCYFRKELGYDDDGNLVK